MDEKKSQAHCCDNCFCNGLRKCSDKMGDLGRILFAASLGIITGIAIFYDSSYSEDDREAIADWLGFPGDLWLNGLKMIVLPLVFANVITSIASMKSMPNSGQLGKYATLFYSLTTLLAATEGLIFANMFIIPTVSDMNLNATTTAADDLETLTFGESVQEIFFSMVPDNIVNAMADGNLLGVIFFAIGMGLIMHPKKHAAVLKLCDEVNEISSGMMRVLITLTPIGVFCLLAPSFIEHDLVAIAGSVGTFLGTVFLALFFHGFVTYPLIFFCWTRKNPFQYYRNIFPAAVMAFSVSSSAATLPTTLECAKKNGVREAVADFVCTLGAVVNMDGTAIGFPIAVIFIAQAEGMELDFGHQILIAIVSTISSMGAAPIPSAGLVLLVMICEATGVPVGGAFGLVLAVDWLYDRPETMVNIIGDSMAAVLMDMKLGESAGFSQMDADGDNGDAGKKQEVALTTVITVP